MKKINNRRRNLVLDIISRNSSYHELIIQQGTDFYIFVEKALAEFTHY